ncbi:MAG: aldo/keto reductase [Spirochaetes bacterium]|nr:aldo/keto reductase [Spirochaetota bacterium]
MKNLNKHPRFGLGCWPLSGKGWKNSGTAESHKLITTALESGVTLFDTAPVYGFGLSEKILGEALEGYSERSSITVATKCGLRTDNGKITHDLSYEFILRDCEASLSRLRCNHIELYQIHWPDPATPLEESFRALRRLMDEKLIGSIGVCNFNVSLLNQALKLGPIVSAQNLYNFLQRDAQNSVLPFCAENELSFIAYSPLAQGLLTPSVNENYIFAKKDIRRLNPLFDIDTGSDTNANNQKKSELFHESLSRKKELGADPIKGALQFLLNDRRVSRILLGTSKIAHLKQILNNLCFD